jgi:hypothetical protein
MLMYISKKYAQKLQKKLSIVVILEATTQKTGSSLEEPDLDPKSSERIPRSRSGPVPYHCFKKWKKVNVLHEKIHAFFEQMKQNS